MRFWTNRRWSERVIMVVCGVICGPILLFMACIAATEIYHKPIKLLWAVLFIIGLILFVLAIALALHAIDHLEDHVKGIKREDESW